jgi:hypothetical protein
MMTGDFNGDGKTDVLMFRSSDGAFAKWFSDGTEDAGWNYQLGNYIGGSPGTVSGAQMISEAITSIVAFAINGQVTAGGSPLAGVTVTLSGGASATTTTDANGNYSFWVPAGGGYTVTPSLSGYTFSPASQTFSNVNGSEPANFTATFSGDSTGSPNPYEIGIPSQFFSIASPSGCTSIAGFWNETSTPQADWTLTQSGNSVSGNAIARYGPSCGTITWSVTGQADTQTTGVFYLTASNPQPATDACGNLANTPINETVTIYESAGCIDGSAQVSSPGGSFSTSWVDPIPPPTQVPTKLSESSSPSFSQPPTTFSGTPNALSCDRQTFLAGGAKVWGYQRCVTFTLLDQVGKAISNVSNLVAYESVTWVKGIQFANLTANGPAIPLNAAAQWGDSLSRVRDDHAIPAGTYAVYKQTVTIKNTSTGQTYSRIRVNCRRYGDTDVTDTDVTSQADQSCMSN